MYIVGNTITKEIVETSGIYHSGNPPVETIVANIISRNGGEPDHYSVYFLNDPTLEDKIIHGAYFDLMWTEDSITALNFDRDFSRLKLKVTGDKEILGLGESIVFTGEILDKFGNLDTTYNETKIIQIRTPVQILRIRVTFKDGVCRHTFTPSQYGNYYIPNSDRYEDEFIVDTQLHFETLYEADNDLIDTID